MRRRSARNAQDHDDKGQETDQLTVKEGKGKRDRDRCTVDRMHDQRPSPSAGVFGLAGCCILDEPWAWSWESERAVYTTPLMHSLPPAAAAAVLLFSLYMLFVPFRGLFLSSASFYSRRLDKGRPPLHRLFRRQPTN